MKFIIELAKARKPYGHTAYTRRTKTGKLAMVHARGVKPQEAKPESSMVFSNPYTKEDHLYYDIARELMKKQPTKTKAINTIIKKHILKTYEASPEELIETTRSIWEELVNDGAIKTPKIVKPPITVKKLIDKELEGLFLDLNKPLSFFEGAIVKATGIRIKSSTKLTEYQSLSSTRAISKAIEGLAKVLDWDPDEFKEARIGVMVKSPTDHIALEKDRAYYDSSTREIVIHKEAGEGPFHHEFGHMLDHLMSVGGGPFNSENYDTTTGTHALIKAMRKSHSFRTWDHVPFEIFPNKTKEQNTKYVKYLQSPVEMFARFFDQWVAVKLEEKGFSPGNFSNACWHRYGRQGFTREDFDEIRPLFEKVIAKRIRKAFFLLLDLFKGRRKGSVNEGHKWVARYKTVGSDKWQYIQADDKEVDDEGNLTDTKPITVIRRFFGVEKPSEVEKRKAKGIKSPIPYAQTQQARIVTTWGVDSEGKRVAVGRKISGKDITPYGTVAALEMSPKYTDQVRELPDSITQFIATPEQQAAYDAKIKDLPVGSGGGVVPSDHTAVPPGEGGNIHVVIPVDGVQYNQDHFIGGEANVKTTSAVKTGKEHKWSPKKWFPHPSGEMTTGAQTKTEAGNVALVVKVSKHDPELVAKYGDEGILEEAITNRPYATQVTAGTFRATAKNEGRLFDEWKNDLYRIARTSVNEALVHSKTYQDRYNADHGAQRDPYNKGSFAGSWLKEQTQELYQVLSAKFIELAREYQPKSDDSNDRFDKWILSKMKWGARHYTDDQAKRHQAELPIDTHEAHDVAAKELSPLDMADYKRYAPIAKKYLEAAIEDLPEAQKKIISMRLWLDSSESEEEEKKDVRARIGGADGDFWDAPAEGHTKRALKNFERSFSDIARKYPTGWKTPITGRDVNFDVSNPVGLARATDTLERWYKTGLEAVLSNFVASKTKDGVEGEDQIRDAKTGLTFNPQGYAVYRALEVATKMARSVKPRAMPSATDQSTTSEVFQQDHMKTHSKRMPAKYPELHYLEKHPELVRRLGLAQGEIKVPAYTDKKKVSLTPGVTYISAPLPRKYGLPETYVEHRPLVMTAEQERRHRMIKTAHGFMNKLSGLPTAELKTRATQHKAYLAKVHGHLGKKTPEQFVDNMRWIASGTNGLKSTDPKVRTKIENQVIQMAKDYHDANTRLGIASPSQEVINVIQSLQPGWDHLPADAQKEALDERYRHFAEIGLEQNARDLAAALRVAHDESKMLDYAHEHRTGTVKVGIAKATVDSFLFIVEGYEDALDRALVRMAS